MRNKKEKYEFVIESPNPKKNNKRHSIGSPSPVKFHIFGDKGNKTPLGKVLFDDDEKIFSTPKNKNIKFKNYWSPDSPAYNTKGNILSGEKPILISYEINLDSAQSVTFDIAGSNFRPKTKRGGKLTKIQGDHVTAYRVFLELVWAGIDNQTPKDGIKTLINIAKSYLSKNDGAKLEEIKNKYLKSLEEKLISREDRKNTSLLLKLLGEEKDKVAKSTDNKILKDMLQDKNISKLLGSDYIKKMSMSIKRDKLGIMSGYLIDIVTKTLTWTNQMEYTTFSKNRAEGIEKREYIFGESVAVKSLKSLDRLIFIDNISNKIKKNNNIADGIKDKKKKNNMLNKIKKDEIKKNMMLDNFSSKFGNGRRYYINGLSIFIYKSKKAQNILNIKINPKSKNNTKIKNIRDFLGENIKKKYSNILKSITSEKASLIEAIADLMESLYDYRYTGKNNYSFDAAVDSFDILARTSARHIVIIFQAFKNIQNLANDLNIRDLVIERFLEKVFENQNWNKFKIKNKTQKEVLKYFGDKVRKSTKNFLLLKERKTNETKKIQTKRYRIRRRKKFNQHK